MTPDDFYVAKAMESEGWEFIGLADDGDMMFTRIIGGVTYGADVRRDR